MALFGRWDDLCAWTASSAVFRRLLRWAFHARCAPFSLGGARLCTGTHSAPLVHDGMIRAIICIGCWQHGHRCFRFTVPASWFWAASSAGALGVMIMGAAPLPCCTRCRVLLIRSPPPAPSPFRFTLGMLVPRSLSRGYRHRSAGSGVVVAVVAHGAEFGGLHMAEVSRGKPHSGFRCV